MGKHPFVLVSNVEDDQIGGTLLTSVPYAMRAASLDGFMTREELIGTWVHTSVLTYSNGKSEAVYRKWHFNEDGTCSIMSKFGSTEEYVYIGNGNWLFISGQIMMALDDGQYSCCPALKKGDTVYFGATPFTKQ